jgi:hypothetical protein
VSNEQKPGQQEQAPYLLGDDEFADARAMAAEEDESAYEYVRHTSRKTGATVTYQVRPPTMEEQEANQKAATRKGAQVVKGAGGNPDRVILPDVNGSDLQARNLISSVYVRKDGKWALCWTIHDRQMLMSRRGGGNSLISKLVQAYAKATQLKSVEEEKGNSDASLTDASS